MSISKNSSRAKISESLMSDNIKNIESSLLNHQISSHHSSHEEITLNIQKYCDKEITDISSKQDIENYLYWLFISSQQSDDSVGSYIRLNASLDNLSMNTFQRYFRESSVHDFVSAANSPKRILDIIKKYVADVSEYKDPQVCDDLNYFIPEPILFLLDAFLYENSSRIDVMVNCVDSLVAPARNLYRFLDCQYELYDDNDNVMFLESVRYLFEPFFNATYQEKAYKKVRTDVVRGMPGSVAYRIGLAYLTGSDLELNKQKAKEWFSYGMITGNPYCALAYILYFLDIYVESENLLQKCYFNTYAILLNSLSLVKLVKKSPDNPYLSFSTTLDTSEYDLEETCLFNLLSFLTFMRHETNLEELNFILLHNESDLFFDYLESALKEYQTSARLKSAIAMYLEFIGVIDQNPKLVQKLISAANLHVKDETDVFACISEFFKQGLKEKDEYTLKTYGIVFSFYNGSLDDFPKKYLEILSKKGYGLYSFALGNRILNDKSEKEAQKIWVKAAEQGSGFAMLNLSFNAFIEKNYEQAEFYARGAINYGIVFGYYVLFNVYLNKDPQLAYTYLRYAAEYMFPIAIEKYEKLKSEGIYSPLPFMQDLEDLEITAHYDPEACSIMCYLYSFGCIVPFNEQRALEFHKKAITNGYNSFFPSYKKRFSEITGYSSKPGNLFVPYKKALDLTSSFFNREDSSTDEYKVTEMKIQQIMLKLSQGKTDLERDILFNAYRADTIGKLPHLKQIDDVLKQGMPLFMELENLVNHLVQGSYASLLQDETSHSEIEKAYDFLKNIPLSLNIPNSTYDIAKALLHVRSFSCIPDYQGFKTEILKGTMVGSKSCGLMASIDFSAVCNTAVNTKTTSKAKRMESIPADVFISSIVQ